jgi:hypothetical protein
MNKICEYLSDKIGNFKVRSWLDGSTFSNNARRSDRTRVLDSNELLAGWLGKVPSELWKLLQKAAVNVKNGNNNKTVRRMVESRRYRE